LGRGSVQQQRVSQVVGRQVVGDAASRMVNALGSPTKVVRVLRPQPVTALKRSGVG